MNPHPFPHTLLYGYWDSGLLRSVRDEFPSYNDPRWITYNDPQELGKKAGTEAMHGPATKELLTQLRSHEFITLLETTFDINTLTPDLTGGGMHMSGPNARLALHTDFNEHPTLPGLRRRLNVLIFLEDAWSRDWGGTLYLGANKEIAIEPIFNTTAIFATSATSWHGHPEPITGNHHRRSIAVYYWGERLPGEEGQVDSTIWL